jgi:hypothetical protein
LATPTQYPWIVPFNVPSQGVDSTPLLVCGASITTFVDSIYVCNTTSNDIFVNFYTLCERSMVVTTTYRVNKFIVPRFASAEILTESCLTLQTGDLLYGFSDYSGNLFDCTVSGRQLLEAA